MPVPGAATVFPLEPNSLFDIVRTRSWLTDIQHTVGGHETRSAVRSDAVKRLECKITLASAADLAAFLQLWYTATERLRFLVPLWGEDSVAEGFPTTTRIDCDTTDRDFVAGGKAIVWLTPTVWEAVDIDAVAADHLTLTNPISSTVFWSAYLANGIGAVMVAPLVSAWLAPPNREQLNPEAEHVGLTFDEELGGIAGVDDGVGLPDTPAGVQLVLEAEEGSAELAGLRYHTVTARVIDATLLEIPNPKIDWDVVANGDLPVDDPSVHLSFPWNGKQCHMEFNAGADGTFLVTANYGALSATTEFGG